MFAQDSSRDRSPLLPAAAPASGSRSRSGSVRSARASRSAAATRANLETGMRDAARTPGRRARDPARRAQARAGRRDGRARRSQHFGRIDILINNAAGNFICRAEDLSPNGWNAVIGIVLNGSFYCSRAVGRYMIARGAAARSCRSSPTTSGRAARAPIHSAAAKAGVMSMTQTLAVEWAQHKIRVNAVARADRITRRRQAAVELTRGHRRITDMVPLQRWGKPEESPTRSPSGRARRGLRYRRDPDG